MAKCTSPVENRSVYYFQYRGFKLYRLEHAWKNRVQFSAQVGLNAASYNEIFFFPGAPA